MSNSPLFCCISLTNVVIDNLHLFLRVADRLIDPVIIELKCQDAIAKQQTFTSFDPEKYCHLTQYEKFVTSLGIPGFEFYIGQSSKQMKCQTLTGPEKLKVFGLKPTAQLALQISIPVLSCTGTLVLRSRCVLDLLHVRRGHSSSTKRSHRELRGL